MTKIEKLKSKKVVKMGTKAVRPKARETQEQGSKNPSTPIKRSPAPHAKNRDRIAACRKELRKIKRSPLALARKAHKDAENASMFEHRIQMAKFWSARSIAQVGPRDTFVGTSLRNKGLVRRRVQDAQQAEIRADRILSELATHPGMLQKICKFYLHVHANLSANRLQSSLGIRVQTWGKYHQPRGVVEVGVETLFVDSVQETINADSPGRKKAPLRIIGWETDFEIPIHSVETVMKSFRKTFADELEEGLLELSLPAPSYSAQGLPKKSNPMPAKPKKRR